MRVSISARQYGDGTTIHTAVISNPAHYLFKGDVVARFTSNNRNKLITACMVWMLEREMRHYASTPSQPVPGDWW